MRVLVTGASGQVGGALVKALGPVGLVIATNRDQLDLAQPAQIAATLDRIGPDLIVNAAAYTAVDRAEDERELAFRVNAEAPGVLRGGRQAGTYRLFISQPTTFLTGEARDRGGRTTCPSRCRSMAPASRPVTMRCARPAVRI